MVIIKDKYYFFAIVLGITEKIFIFLLFIFPLRAIKSVLSNSIGAKLKLAFSLLRLPINNQSDLISIFSIIFIVLLISVIIVNRLKRLSINYIKDTKKNFRKNLSLENNLRKLNDVDHHIDIRIYGGYCSMLFIFLVFYDLAIAALIVLSGFISFLQYRRLETLVQKERIFLKINKNSGLTVEEKYENQFALNKLIAKYKESKVIVKAITNTFTMMLIMYSLFFRDDKSSISIIFIFITRLCLNQIDSIVSKYQRKKYKNIDLDFLDT